MMLRKNFGQLFCVVIATFLAGCTQGPSERDVRKLIQGHYDQQYGSSEQAGLIKVENLELLNRFDEGDGHYSVALRYEAAVQGNWGDLSLLGLEGVKILNEGDRFLMSEKYLLRKGDLGWSVVESESQEGEIIRWAMMEQLSAADGDAGAMMGMLGLLLMGSFLGSVL